MNTNEIYYLGQGTEYSNNGDYSKAIECFLEVKTIWEKELDRDHFGYAALLKFLGRLYRRIGDYAHAEEYYLESKSIYEKHGKEQPNYASLLNSLGLLYYDKGDYSKAIECFLELKNIWKRELDRDHFGYAELLGNLGVLYRRIGDYAHAKEFLFEEKTIYEMELGKDHPDYAESLNSLGILYYDMGDYKLAEECYLESKDVWERKPDKEHPYYAELLNSLGVLYNHIGDYARAEEFLLESKVISERQGKKHPDYTTSLNSLGLLYFSKGDYARAKEFFFDAKAIWESVPGVKEHPDYAKSLNNWGLLYCEMGDYAYAKEYLLESKAIRERIQGKEHPDYTTSLNNLGLLYHGMGDYKRAEEYLLESKAILKRILGKECFNYATLLNNLGRLYIDMEDYTRSEEFILESKDIYKRLCKEHPGYATSLDNLGLLYICMVDYTRAEKLFLESKNLRERLLGKEHPDYITSLNHLFCFYLTMREYKQAVVYKEEETQQNTDLVNRIFSFLSGRQREIYWNDSSSSFESSYSLSWFHPVPESNALNYNNALFTKGLLLRTTNAVRDSIKSSGDQNLIEQYDEFSSLRQQIGNLWQRNDGNEAYIKSLEDQAEELDKFLTKASAAFREFQADLTLNWQNVRDKLKPGEAAIEFVSFRLYDKELSTAIYYTALILRSGMNAPEWVPLPNCEETVSVFLKKQNENTSLEQEKKLYDDNGSDLYIAVWQPLEKTLEGVTSVYYSPSGLLHKISFNAIPVKEGLLLTDVYDLNLVSSTREIVYRENKPNQKPDSGVIYGGLQYTVDEDSMKQKAQPYNTSDTETQKETDLPDILRKSDMLQLQWESLPYSRREGKNIESILTKNGIPVDLYMFADGNEESFKALNGKKKSILHISTHGFFFGDIEKKHRDRERLERLGGGQKVFENPLFNSGLILAGGNSAWKGEPVAGVENGILFADDVARMDLLGARLVVLSACSTALGEINNSEGVFGLQRAFKLAGAETLIVSLWNVKDKATSVLMTLFYEKWLSGKSKQEAFKDAQKQLRANPEYSSPFYWAAFVMID